MIKRRDYLTREPLVKVDLRRLLTKTQLKARRLKPAPYQKPATMYWQGQGWVFEYDASQAVPMKPYRAPSAAQSAALAAGRTLVGTSPCYGCQQRIEDYLLNRAGYCGDCVGRLDREEQERNWKAACRHASYVLSLDPLFLDTETTGLDAGAEIVEVAVLDRHGVVLLETLVKPVASVPIEASSIHGLSDIELASAPAWPDIAKRLDDILHGRVVVAHNASFDERMLLQSCTLHTLSLPAVARWECTMELLTDANGDRWPRLSLAMSIAGAELPANVAGRPHRAAYDAECCRQVLLSLAAQSIATEQHGTPDDHL